MFRPEVRHGESAAFSDFWIAFLSDNQPINIKRTKKTINGNSELPSTHWGELLCELFVLFLQDGLLAFLRFDMLVFYLTKCLLHKMKGSLWHFHACILMTLVQSHSLDHSFWFPCPNSLFHFPNHIFNSSSLFSCSFLSPRLYTSGEMSDMYDTYLCVPHLT